jgi:hypothetical protein
MFAIWEPPSSKRITPNKKTRAEIKKPGKIKIRTPKETYTKVFISAKEDKRSLLPDFFLFPIASTRVTIPEATSSTAISCTMKLRAKTGFHISRIPVKSIIIPLNREYDLFVTE